MTKPPKQPDLHLSLQWADTSHKVLMSRAWVKRILRQALQAPAELTVRVVGAEEGQALNLGFRKKDYATNVLTFDYAREPLILADLVLCAPVLEKEAQEQGKDLIAHYAHMLVHGVLHAQGYDHERLKDAKVMEALEVEILSQLGFDHPY